MKFIARKGAPNIPLELLEAQESGQLIFFCGAGISYPAKLPSFSGLVEDVYNTLAVLKDPLEKEAIKEGFFDRALGLLERRIQENNKSGLNLTRRAIIDRLEIDPKANVSTHKAILDLSSTKKQKHRIVTTNVDHGFLIADSMVKSIVDAAPKLPVPKPHKWESIVHLHGIIDKDSDPDGEHLVFTSGDFGSAYLTERWASKFVTELFSHYTVLFVGYSINDPVLRYMTDAISAEMRVGYKKFNQPYILASSAPKDKANDTAAWRAKGVEPILYSYGHPNLHNTLKAWAAYSRDGLNGKARIIREKAKIPPLAPYDQDESVQQVLDTLKEKANKNHSEITGYPARVFSEIKDPPVPIEWLPVLHENRLLSISQMNDTVYPVSLSPVGSNLLYPNEISHYLWLWLLKHLESDFLILWVLNNGICLHPRLDELIEREITHNPPKEPYLTFWRILVSGYVKCSVTGSHIDEYTAINSLKQYRDLLGYKQLQDLIDPKIKLTKSFYWPASWGEDEETADKKPYDAEVSIGLTDWSFKELEKLEGYPHEFTHLLMYATNSLNRAMELWEFLGFVDERNDRSYWDLVSISPHEQNKNYRSWVILIEICRDLWLSCYETDIERANSVLNIWKINKFPIFRRLVLYSYTITNISSSEDSLKYLLEDDCWWLWSIVTQRERYRLLAKIWPGLSDDSTKELISAILNGPPREMYRADLSPDEWTERHDRDIWHILMKLNSFGRQIPDDAHRILNEIQNRYPNWQFAVGERDEFTHWSETRVGNDTDITTDNLFELAIPDLVDKLLDDNREFIDGRIDVFRSGTKEHQDKVIEILTYISINDIKANKIWHAALVGLADTEKPNWDVVAKLISDVHDELYSEEAWAVAWWTRKAAVNLAPFSDNEKLFWIIANRLLENAKDKEIDDDSDIITMAINNPVGIITEAIIERFSQCKLEAGEGIPGDEHLSILNNIMSKDGRKYLLGRVIIASRLQYFFAIDPDWTRQNIILKLDWETSHEAKYLWQGYLWVPRVTADLALEIKKPLQQALAYAEQIEKHPDRLFQIFVVICIEYQDLYSTEEQRLIMVSIGVKGLIDISEFLWRSVSGEQEKK